MQCTIFSAGAVKEHELLRTLNCGIGGALIVSPEDQAAVIKLLAGQKSYEIGVVKQSTGGE
jgi:phosphoribosylaminoimidazole (AIR) synthetase